MVRVAVADLRQELEQLFPGKWLSGGESARTLKTGIESFDKTFAAGLVRRQITEWTGGASSGKSTVLRTICANWCASGLNVIYVDTFDRLLPSDWSDVARDTSGRFWVLRSGAAANYPANRASTTPPAFNQYDLLKNALWGCEQLIRSRAFDVVIIDLADRGMVTSNIYARLKRSLERSNASLIVLKDDPSNGSQSWGASAQMQFGFVAPLKVLAGLNGPAAIVPTIASSLFRDGMSRSLEVTVAPYVPNRMFTHTPVPDRRTPKAR